MKKVCARCGAKGDFDCEDQFYDNGWNAIQCHSRKKHYFCHEHTAKDVLGFLMFRDIADSASPEVARQFQRKAEKYMGETSEGRVHAMKKKVGIGFSKCSGCGNLYNDGGLAYQMDGRRLCLDCEIGGK